MAAQLGTVEVPVEIVWSPNALRAVALEKALQLASSNHGQGLIVTAESLVESAKTIEAYLNGPDPQQGAEALVVEPEDVFEFKREWHTANREGDVGHRVERGLKAVFDGRRDAQRS